MNVYLFIKRLMDFCTALVFGIFFLPIAILVALLVKLTSSGPILFWSERVGKDNQRFNMPKFRTMKTETPTVATHRLQNPESHLTRIGGFLRRASLDEIPQLWSVFIGDMSLVGPRPALYNQDDLIQLRAELGIDSLRPGVTGWAQINGRDELSIKDKVTFDAEYLQRKGFLFDLEIIAKTAVVVFLSKSVSH